MSRMAHLPQDDGECTWPWKSPLPSLWRSLPCLLSRSEVMMMNANIGDYISTTLHWARVLLSTYRIIIFWMYPMSIEYLERNWTWTTTTLSFFLSFFFSLKPDYLPACRGWCSEYNQSINQLFIHSRMNKSIRKYEITLLTLRSYQCEAMKYNCCKPTSLSLSL